MYFLRQIQSRGESLIIRDLVEVPRSCLFVGHISLAANSNLFTFLRSGRFFWQQINFCVDRWSQKELWEKAFTAVQNVFFFFDNSNFLRGVTVVGKCDVAKSQMICVLTKCDTATCQCIYKIISLKVLKYTLTNSSYMQNFLTLIRNEYDQFSSSCMTWLQLNTYEITQNMPKIWLGVFLFALLYTNHTLIIYIFNQSKKAK